MNKSISIAVAFSALLLGTRCASDGGGTQPEPVEPTTVAELCEEPARYLDQAVRLAGVFQGFLVTECSFPEAASRTGQTRRDWLFRTERDCLYVTGGEPAGIEILDSSFVGRRLELTARVERNAAGLIYLHFLAGRLLAE